MKVSGTRRIGSATLTTPAFIIDQAQLKDSLRVAKEISEQASCQLLYSLKANSLWSVLELVAESVKGFGCSSLFEAVLGGSLCGRNRTLHYVSPGLVQRDLDPLLEVCDYVTLNSLSQIRRFSEEIISNKLRCGARVNPELSFLPDERYDPCRTNSKLGIPLTELVEMVGSKSPDLSNLTGIHVHNNCDSTDFAELLQTVEHLSRLIPGILDRIDWINLGGGYLFSESVNRQAFYEAVGLLRARYDLEVFVEPGAALVGSAGSLVATVADHFKSGDKEIVVLDTTTNHLPEVFEFQFQPEIEGGDANGPYEYTIVGSSCLAGDVFGQYSFTKPLNIGSRVVFPNVGAYSMVKANMFNGINLPTVYHLISTGTVVERHRFGYKDFANRYGVECNVVV